MNPPTVDTQAAKEAAVRKDREKLQGTWRTVSGLRAAEMLISGNHFTVKFRTGDIYVGTFELDPTAKPKRMDMLINEGPERHRGRVSLAIYEMDGDYLIWSPNEPGCGQRARAFPPSEDPQNLCLVFQRDRK